MRYPITSRGSILKDKLLFQIFNSMGQLTLRDEGFVPGRKNRGTSSSAAMEIHMLDKDVASMRTH
jgi:hypothetical protein